MDCTDSTSHKPERQQQDVSESQNREPRKVLTVVPVQYLVDAVRLANGRPLVASLLLLLSHIATSSKQRSVRITQQLLDRSPGIGSRVRRQVITLWRDSATTQCPDRHDYAKRIRSLEYQHRHEIPYPHKLRARLRLRLSTTKHNKTNSAVVPTLIPKGCDGLEEMGLRWVEGETIEGMECAWVEWDRSAVDEALAAGARMLGWDRVRMVAAMGCDELVDMCDLDKADLVTEARAAIVEAGALEQKVDQIVISHVDAVERFHSEGCTVRYSGGRIHSRLTTVPKWYRDLYLGFAGGTDRLDIRGCYPWLIAAECLRERRAARDWVAVRDLESLCEVIESGKLYETIASLAGVETSDAKADFQRMCLFGRSVGRPHNRLWGAMMRLCPAWCGYVLRIREQRSGASRLAHRLMRLEGYLICAGAALDLADDGVPCATIHDGMWVPAGRGELAAMHIRLRATERWGRSPGLKIEHVGRPVETRRQAVRPVVANEFEGVPF